jgi:electron transfer flavoprotein beta subunit
MPWGERTMKILVCAKQICHVVAGSGRDPGEHFLTPEDRIVRINPYDEAALEMALQIREESGEGEVILVTLGPLIAEEELRRCLALGADSVYRISIDSEMDPWSKSFFLARAARELRADLVLCGKESSDRRNGQVGAFLAHRLGAPFISAITRLTVFESAHAARAERRAGHGVVEILQCGLPAVMSVELGIEVRLPTYARRNWSLSAPWVNLHYDSGDEGTMTEVRGVFPARPRPKPLAAPDSGQEAFYRVEQLLAGSCTKRKGQLLTGTPESQVEEIAAFLVQKGLLESKP